MIANLSVTFEATHPSLPGHFPGEPMVPGAVLLDHAIDCIERVYVRRVMTVLSAKFVTPVRPLDTVVFELRDADGNRVAVTATVSGVMVFSASALLES